MKNEWISIPGCKNRQSEEIREAIEVILDAARIKIERLAYLYREKVLLPFCRKYQIVFASGNGVYAFFSKSGLLLEFEYWCELDSDDFENWEEVFEKGNKIAEVLALGTLSDGCHFSQYVEDVTKKDIGLEG